MARIYNDLPDDIFEQLIKVGKHFSEISEKMLTEAAEIGERIVREELTAAISTSPDDVKRQTGQLLQSLGISPIGTGKKGAKDSRNISIGFASNRSRGSNSKRNGELAAYLEYGVKKGETGQREARPFMKRATRRAESPIEEKMREVFEREVSKI